MVAGARGPDPNPNPNPNPGPKPYRVPPPPPPPRGTWGLDLNQNPGPKLHTRNPKSEIGPALRGARPLRQPRQPAPPAPPAPNAASRFCPPFTHAAAWMRFPASGSTRRRKAGGPQSGTQVEPGWNLVIRAWNPGGTGAPAGVPPMAA